MDDRGILELLQAMVRAPSHPGVPRQEEATARILDAHLRRHGIRSELIDVREGRPKGPSRPSITMFMMIKGRS